MHEVGFPLDLSVLTRLIPTLFFLAVGVFYFLRNTAAKYFDIGAAAAAAGGFDSEVGAEDCTTKCSRCNSVRYCSEECQTSDWSSAHQRWCRDTTTLTPSARNGLRFRASRDCTERDQTKISFKPREVLFPYEEFVKYFNWDYPELAPCGLMNCGNSCFANVILQCLSWTRPLVAYLLERGHRSECMRDDWCFFCAFQTHVERASQSRYPFSPVNIISRLTNIGGTLGYGRQEDAHEFMRYAIDTMQSVCLDEFGGEKMVPPRCQETTLVQYIFGGLLQSQVQCTVCNNVSEQYENMMDLTVEIHGDAASLEECLDQFTAREWLQGDNMYKCDRCSDYVKACKRLTIRRPPNVLTIALKRFKGGRYGKLNKRISFPETLDLRPYMSQGGEGSDVYTLYAVIVHLDMLNASFFGHYICYIKDFSGNWYRIDDSERRVFCNWWTGTKQSSRMSSNIFLECETERDEAGMEENERDAERYEYEIDTERDRSPCYEEARVERNVRDFVDEDVDLFATPVGSDDDQDGNEGDGYFTYKKGSGELQLKQAFDSLQAFKQAMVDYVLKHGWNVKYVRWDKDKSELKCASEAEEGEEACMWRIYCSYEAPLQKWMVKVYVKDHSCSKSGYSRLITQEVIAKLFKDDLRDDPKIMPKEILVDIQKRWELTVTIDQCRNAKTRALEMIKEENDQQFSRLRDYRVELLESNEDSTVELETFNGDDGSDVFYRLYVCFAALKKTWCAHCRPIFGLDACFLKCTTKGQLLAAVGRDANNQMFPIAWTVVDVESEDNWVWFIEKLQTDLNLHDGEGFTIISDRQKGLLNAVSNILPMVEHRMCARHIYANLKKKHPHRADMKGKFWKVAKSYNMAQYNKRVDEVKAYDMSVYDSMMMKNPKNCSLAFFTPSSTCDDVSNNISESFNHAVDPARSMPLVEMLETIRRRAMLRIEARKMKAMNHRGKFSLKAMEKVSEEQRKIRHCTIYPCGYEVYEVKEKNSSYKTKMVDRTCTCRKWEMSGLPCRHALKIISAKKRKQEDYMAACYLTSTWRKQYETPIKAVHGINFWKKIGDAEIIPPPTEPESSRGRKKIPKRIKGRNESPSKKKTKVRNESPSKVSRERRIIHCGRCGEGGHNARKCKNIGVPVQRPPKKKNVTQVEGSNQPTQSQVVH